jgi:Activator of Hsp90 ATPase homolog 1-like protein
MSSTRIVRRVNAPRATVYRALLDARAIATWRVPTGMTGHVHAFDAREGGSFRISLTYDAPTGTGKTTPHTDTYSDLPQSENKVTIKNGTPGLTHLRIQVNEKKFEIAGLADDEELTLDISSALVAGNKNTIVLIPLGKPGGSSTVLIHE